MTDPGVTEGGVTDGAGRGREALRAVGEFVRSGSESAFHGVGVIGSWLGRGIAAVWHGITDFPNPFH